MRPLVLLLAALSAAPAVGEESGVITARLEWEPGAVGGYRQTDVALTSEAPEGIELPAGLKDGRFARVPLGDGPGLLLVLDEHPEHRRIWIDRNLDDSLKDDPHSAWTPSGALSRRTETILLPFKTERTPVPVEIHVVRPSGDSVEALKLQVRIHRRGTVVLGGRVRNIALRDDRNELRFNRGGGIVLFADADGDGRFAVKHGTHEHLHEKDLLRVGEQAWSYKVTGPEGAVVEFHPVKPGAAAPVRGWVDQKPPESPRKVPVVTKSLKELTADFERELKGKTPQRASALTKIGDEGSEAAWRYLTVVLKAESDPAVRGMVVRAMGNPAFAAAHGREVLKLTGDGNAVIVRAALQSLHFMDLAGRERHLKEMAKSAPGVLAGEAVMYLAYIGTDSARKAALAAYEELSFSAARYSGYRGLRTLKGGPPVDVLLRAAEDDNHQVRAYALEDLFSLGHPATRGLLLKAAAARPLVTVSFARFMKLLACYPDAEAIGAVLAGATELANDANRQSDVAAVVMALQRHRSAPVVAELRRALGARDPALRLLAAQILAGIPEPGISDDLAKRMKREKDPAVREAVVLALGDQADPSTAGVLLKAVREKGPVRVAALRGLARIGIVNRDIRKLFVKLLRSKVPEDRILAIDAVGTAGELDLAKKVLDSLDHDVWQVRLAVVEALRKMRAREWVMPLIEHLEDEEVRRIRVLIGETLFEHTGTNLYDEHKLWARWWEEHGETFIVPGEIPSLPPVEAGGSVGVFYGLPVDSERVIFVIDQSGSMSATDATNAAGRDDRKNRLEVAIMETLAAINNLGRKAYVNVVLFHSTIHPWRKTLSPLNAANRSDLRKHLGKQQPTGGTNLYDGLEQALEDPNVDTIMLLSDGVPGAGRFVTTDAILREVRRRNQTRRIAIHCVSLGRDSDLMEKLATENGGRYVRR